MSFVPTGFRPLARSQWGGRAASHFRGALAISGPNVGLPIQNPQTLTGNYWGQIGTAVYRSTGVARNFSISGVTKDSAGAAIGTCVVDLFVTGSDQLLYATTSDASGNFRFNNPGTGPFYLVAYKVGSPDVAGTTVNTLVAAAA